MPNMPSSPVGAMINAPASSSLGQAVSSAQPQQQSQPPQDQGRSLQDLSNDEFTHLRDSIKSGKIDAKAQTIISSLNNQAFQQIRPQSQTNSANTASPQAPQQGPNTSVAPTPQNAPQSPNQGNPQDAARAAAIGGGVSDAVTSGVFKGTASAAAVVQRGIDFLIKGIGAGVEKVTGSTTIKDYGNKLLKGADALEQDMTQQAPDQITAQGEKNHPYIAGAAKIGTELGIGAALGTGAASTIADSLGAGTAAKVGANAVVNGITGAGMNSNNQGTGFILGAGTSLGADAIGGYMSKAIDGATLKTKLNNAVEEVNKAIPPNMSTDQAAQAAIKNKFVTATNAKNEMYGELNPLPLTKNPQEINDKITSFVKDNKDILNQDQLGSLKTIMQNNNRSVQTFNDLHKVQMDVSGEYNNFKSSSGIIRNFYDDLQTTVRSQLQATAAANGKTSEFEQANNFFKTSYQDLLKNKADKIASGNVNIDGIIDKSLQAKGSPVRLSQLVNTMDNTGQDIIQAHIVNRMVENMQVGSTGWDPAKALTKLSQFRKSFGSVLDQDHQDVLNGISKIISSAPTVREASAGEQAMRGGIMSAVDGKKLGAAVGGFLGATSMIPGGTTMGAAAGAGIEAIANPIIKKLVQSRMGQNVLMSIGKSTNGTPIAKQMFKQITTSAESHVVNGATQQGGTGGVQEQLANEMLSGTNQTNQ